MSERMVELRQVGIRNVIPLRLQWQEFYSVLYVCLDLVPEEMADQLSSFFCPDCSFRIVNGYFLKKSCEYVIRNIKDNFTMTDILLKRLVNPAKLLFTEKKSEGEPPFDSKRIKSICRVLIDWLKNDYSTVRVIDSPNVCSHPKAFQSDIELYGNGGQQGLGRVCP